MSFKHVLLLFAAALSMAQTDGTVKSGVKQPDGTIDWVINAPATLDLNPPGTVVTLQKKSSPPPPQTQQIAVSSLQIQVVANGWGQPELNRSNGEQAAGDGKTLTINGTTYASGLGTHAASDLTVTLPTGCSVFTAQVGIDDEVAPGMGDGARFVVSQGGKVLYTSPIKTSSQAATAVSVPLSTSATSLRLQTTVNSTFNYDHTDWGNATVTCPATTTPPPPPPDEICGNGIDDDKDGQVDEGCPPSGGGWTPPPTDAVANPGDNLNSKVSSLPAGGSLLVKNGTYRITSPLAMQGKKLYGESQTGVIISGARVLTMVQDGARWKATGQTQQGPVAGSVQDEQCRAPGYRCGYPEDLFLNGAWLLHVPTLAEVGPGKWHFDYGTDTIWMGDNPAGKVVETSVTSAATSGNSYTLSHVTVDKFATPTNSGAIGGDGVTFDAVTSQNNHYSGMWPGIGGKIVNGSKSLNNGAFGVNGSGDNILVEDTEIAGNNAAHYNWYWGAGGTKFVWTGGLIVRRVFSHHNRGWGLWTDINNHTVTFDSNIVEDNPGGGIFHEIGYSAVIKNNQIRRNGFGALNSYHVDGAGIAVVGSANVEVYGNVLADNYQGIGANDDCRGNGSMGVWEVRNLSVHDNAITTGSSGPGTQRTGLMSNPGNNACAASSFTSKNNRFERNTYSLGANPNYFMWLNGDRNESYWQTTAGQDTAGTIVRR